MPNHDEDHDPKRSRLVSLARSLMNKGGALQSTEGREKIDQTKLSDALEKQMRQNLAAEDAPLAKVAAAQSLANAESALRKSADPASSDTLTELEVASLEAIIEVTGRPAMRYQDGRVQMPEDLGENGNWRTLIATARSDINNASESVGRVMMKGATGLAENIGTGWRLGPDLIVTNRHVAKLMAVDPEADPATLKVDQAKEPFIDFAATDNAQAAIRFTLASIVFCAIEPELDLAFLRVTSGVQNLPAPLSVDFSPQGPGREIVAANGGEPGFKGNEIYVVGHPFKQRRSEAIATVFGTADGLKRWSPGFVLRINKADSSMQHDCSTLGGNSGSCVFSVDHSVIGIHVGGMEVDELTDRARANLAVAFGLLSAHPALEILKQPEVLPHG